MTPLLPTTRKSVRRERRGINNRNTRVDVPTGVPEVDEYFKVLAKEIRKKASKEAADNASMWVVSGPASRGAAAFRSAAPIGSGASGEVAKWIVPDDVSGKKKTSEHEGWGQSNAQVKKDESPEFVQQKKPQDEAPQNPAPPTVALPTQPNPLVNAPGATVAPMPIELSVTPVTTKEGWDSGQQPQNNTPPTPPQQIPNVSGDTQSPPPAAPPIVPPAPSSGGGGK